MSETATEDGRRDGPPPDHVLSAVDGRRLVMALGGAYVALVATYPFLPIVDDPSSVLLTVLGILVGGPGVVLLYGGYRLPRSDVRPELYATVATWCLRGVGVTLGILILIALASSDSNVVANGLLLTALGSLGGFAAGVHDARAKTRELELQETIEALRTSNERLEQFAFAASHDLQEPLRMVSSYLQLLDGRYEDELDEDAREYLDFAVDGADRMRAMVDSLLDYSRVRTGGEPMEPTDAEAVLDDARVDLRQRIEETDATITAEDLPRVTADADQLAQVFRNLLDNAISYSGDAPPTMHVGAERNGDSWELSVADEGVGIDPEYHEQVFEVFERLHVGDDAAGKNAGGIGLALCERIVERHGGDIRVDSEPGEGATFTFTLPAVDAED